MTGLEIVAGIILIVVCLTVIAVVLSQESKGQGLSGVITGTEMMSGESRNRSKESRQANVTRIAAVILFVVTIGVNLVSGFVAK